jgi:sugar/nucleoside kinase (ribokinase family)
MITTEHLSAAAAVVDSLGAGDAAATALRSQWPALRFVACSDDDVPPHLPAAAEGPGYALYLIAGSEHCLSLTTDANVAIGLVVAEVAPED